MSLRIFGQRRTSTINLALQVEWSTLHNIQRFKTLTSDNNQEHGKKKKQKLDAVTYNSQ